MSRGTRYSPGDRVKLQNREGVFEVIDVENPGSKSPDYFVESRESGEVLEAKAGNMKKLKGFVPGFIEEDPQDEFFEEPDRTYEVLVIGKDTDTKLDADKFVTVEAEDRAEARIKALEKAQDSVEGTSIVYQETGIPEEVGN